MPRVINEGYTTHRIPQHKKVKLPNGDDILESVFSQTWEFPAKTEKGVVIETEVPKEELDLMLDKDDHTQCRIYTKKQYNDRLKLIAEQKDLKEQFDEETDEKIQKELLKKLTVNNRQRYLIHNDLPHVA
jgi:hypothetical protein